MQMDQLIMMVHNILCMYVIIHFFTLQRQQYPNLPEPEVRQKAELWKQCDEKEQERRRAFYRDIFSKQQSVSPNIWSGFTHLWVWVSVSVNACVCTACGHSHVSTIFPRQLTLSIQAMLNSQRNQVMQTSTTTVNQQGQTWTRKPCYGWKKKKKWCFCSSSCNSDLVPSLLYQSVVCLYNRRMPYRNPHNSSMFWNQLLITFEFEVSYS